MIAKGSQSVETVNPSRSLINVVAQAGEEQLELAGFGIREADAQSLVEGRGRVPQAEE